MGNVNTNERKERATRTFITETKTPSVPPARIHNINAGRNVNIIQHIHPPANPQPAVHINPPANPQPGFHLRLGELEIQISEGAIAKVCQTCMAIFAIIKLIDELGDVYEAISGSLHLVVRAKRQCRSSVFLTALQHITRVLNNKLADTMSVMSPSSKKYKVHVSITQTGDDNTVFVKRKGVHVQLRVPRTVRAAVDRILRKDKFALTKDQQDLVLKFVQNNQNFGYVVGVFLMHNNHYQPNSGWNAYLQQLVNNGSTQMELRNAIQSYNQDREHKQTSKGTCGCEEFLSLFIVQLCLVTTKSSSMPMCI